MDLQDMRIALSIARHQTLTRAARELYVSQPTLSKCLRKLEEEAGELRRAVEAGGDASLPHGVREELGDLLFIAANLAQLVGVDPEDALHRACDKFDGRFRRMEEAADKPFSDCGEAELVELWRSAKEDES